MHKDENIKEKIKHTSRFMKKYKHKAPIAKKNKVTEIALLKIRKKSINTVIKYMIQTVIRPKNIF